MAKKSIRKVHIDGEVWKWIVNPTQWYGAITGVRVYSPTKRQYTIKGEDLTNERVNVGIEGEYPTNIKPAQVKKYILQKILNRTT